MKDVTINKSHNHTGDETNMNFMSFGYNGIFEPSTIKNNYRKFHNLYVQTNKHSTGIINFDILS